MAVSCSTSIARPVLAHRVCIYSPLGDRYLRCALLDIGPGHVHHPRSMFCFACEVDLNVLGLLTLLPLSGFFRYFFRYFQMSAIRSRRHSPAEKPFVRTHIGMYFFSLLICNLAQALGAILNIPWIVEKRIYLGTVCAAQATIQQIGGVLDFCPFRRRLSSDTSQGRNSNFLFSNRRPHLQPVVSSPPMVRSHILYHPHRLMGYSRTRHMYWRISS